MTSTPSAHFATVRVVEWTFLDSLLSRTELPFVHDLWHEFGPIIDGLTDPVQKQFAQLVATISAFRLCLDDDETFGSAWQMNGRRALVPSDLDPVAIEALSTAFDTCPHLDLKARIGDTLWIAGRHLASMQRRRFDVVRTTVGIYLQTAERALSSNPNQALHIVPISERIARAAQIAREINQPATTQSVDAWLIACIDGRKTVDTGPLCRNLLEIRLDQHFATPTTIVAESDAIAVRLQSAGALDPAGMYFDLSIRAARRTQDNEVIKRCHRNCAQQSIALAEAYLRASPEAWAPAGGQYNRALRHLREAGAGRVETDAVQASILRLNQQGAASCGSIEVPIDLTELNRHLDTLFDTLEFSEALDVVLFRTLNPKGYDYHRAALNDSMQEFSFQLMMPISRMSYDGRVEAVAGGALDGTDENFHKRMMHHIGMLQGFEGIQLRAVRRVFLDHFPMNLRMCERFAIDSPLVPNDRVQSVSLAIWRGWQGRWLESMHLLIPQLEHIIRRILQSRGIVITVPDTQEQNYIDLGGLLSQHESALATVLGEGEVLALRVACTERVALNRRNDLCHGLVPDNRFGVPTDVFLWWLFQRMLLKPLFHSDTAVPSDVAVNVPEAQTPT